MRFNDLSGRKIGRLLILSTFERRTSSNKTRIFWKCQCDCGKELFIVSSSLTTGNTNSCGCLHNEILASIKYKHGEANKTVEYRAWAKIISRCHTKTDPKYYLYGAKGVKVCDRWRNSYILFLEDMGRRPDDKTSIDRYPNKDGDYEPGNSRWADAKQQANNLRNNIILSYENEELTLSQLSGKLGINYKRFHKLYRINKLTIEKIKEKYGIV